MKLGQYRNMLMTSYDFLSIAGLYEISGFFSGFLSRKEIGCLFLQWCKKIGVFGYCKPSLNVIQRGLKVSPTDI